MKLTVRPYLTYNRGYCHIFLPSSTLTLHYSLAISEPFQLCNPFNGTKQEDVANFIASLVGIAMGAVQYDFNAKSHGLMDVTKVCETMTDTRNGNSAMQRLAKLNEL